MKTQNPFDESILAEYECHSDEQVLEARTNRRTAPQQLLVYESATLEERQEQLKSTARLLLKRCDQLSQMMTAEMGKPIAQSKVEVEKSAACCEFYAQHAPEMLQSKVVNTEASFSEVRFEPLGTILAIMPWNFPVWQVVRCAAPALMAGNRILLKHAPNVCGCADLLQAVFDESFGEFAVCNLRISHDETARLIRSSEVAAVTLTGSERAGREVGRVAGEAIKKCVMELGGVDPLIVLEDAHVPTAVAAAVAARMMNNGQSCIAAKRLIVMENIVDEFTECFVETMKQIPMGDPMDPETKLGPLARKDLRDTLHLQVQDDLQKPNVRLLCGGIVPNRTGWFYPPTVIAQQNVDGNNHIPETFGPVAKIETAKQSEDWLSLLADSDYGLGASIWTPDIERAKRIASQLRSGSVFINEVTKSDPRLPFGGIRLSGYGRELSEIGLREFTNVKTVWIE